MKKVVMGTILLLASSSYDCVIETTREEGDAEPFSTVGACALVGRNKVEGFTCLTGSCMPIPS